MKKIFCSLLGLVLCATLHAQPPQLMSYQAIIRNGNNQLVANAPAGMRVSILQGSASGIAVYTETHNANTNAQGLATLAIGGGTAQSGTFAGINWANGPYFLKVETDPFGGSNYTVTATSQLLSVPYAQFSATAANGVPSGAAQGQVITFCDGVPVWTNGGLCPGKITALGCGAATNTGTLTASLAASGVSSTVPYTGGNGGVYSAQSIASTGVTGLTATLTAGTLANGTGSLTYIITGAASGSGIATFAVSFGGQNCVLSRNVNGYAAGTVHCNGTPTAIVYVTNPTTGKVWMDRNLGASQISTSSTDATSYGDLYQWGRRADGHQCRNSATVSLLGTSDQPPNGNFILAPNSPLDWRSPQNNNLWQGVLGINNPCPLTFRIPTSIELDAERVSWISNTAAGAFASPLKIALAGYRLCGNGSLFNLGSGGFYWSSTVGGTNATQLVFYTNNVGISNDYRADGCSVRCIKD